jgi:DUF1680 family protein
LVAAQRRDRLEPVTQVRLHDDGYLGSRAAGNLRRLLDVELGPLLAGFQHRPGEHPWIGEHIGKWLDAAARTWRDTGDEALRARLDQAVRALLQTQEEDGYLGTYAPQTRMGGYPGADWDVWTHKYVLIGLLSYHRYTGDEHALRSARRIADLLDSALDSPERILAAGWHTGMAATSVLEPLVLLFRHTSDERYLRFAHRVVDAWDAPGGPRVLSTLLETGRVSEVGNGKAYEMLSNIVGLVELARVEPDGPYLDAALRAWHDVVAHHRYLTGTASFGEHFHRPDELPDSVSVNMGETCVTVTWLHLSRQLLALTGDAAVADEIERTLYNHLSAAQLPDGSAWCYYTPLDGYRSYGSGISCCISSGPRGMASAAESVFALCTDRDELTVVLYEGAVACVDLGGQRVTVTLTSDAPFAGGAELAFAVDGAAVATFGLRLRRPPWAREFAVDLPGVRPESGWLVVPPRQWRHGDRVSIAFHIDAHEIDGTSWNRGRVALGWGPLVLGYRTEPADALVPAAFDIHEGHPYTPISGERSTVPWRVANRLAPQGARGAVLAPFALLGADGGRARVWLARQDGGQPLSLLHGATESRSSGDPRRGSVADYDDAAFASTEDGQTHDEEWFALDLDHPIAFGRVVIVHGRTLVHGGWFDTSAQPLRLQARDSAGGAWRTVATVAGYPATTASHPGGLRGGERFEVVLDRPVTAAGLRLLGRGSYGDYGPAVFATCARLAAFR